MSSTASVHSAKDVSPVERAQPVKTVDEYEDAEKNFQPKSFKFWTIIIGMYLSIFLVALVSFIVQHTAPDSQVELTPTLGSNDYCNGHSTHYRRVQIYPGHWLVWQCLHVDCRLFHPHFWPHLSALLDKTGLPALNCDL